MCAASSGISVSNRHPSLHQLLDPDILADPYPLYRRLRESDPVAWDPFLHAWVVTNYAGVLTVLHKFSADRTPTPEQLTAMGLKSLQPVAEVMVRQMLFMDAPAHTRLRGLCSSAFTSRSVDHLRPHIQEIADDLIDRVFAQGRMDVIADFAAPLPAIVTAELLGVPTSDHEQLKNWSADFAEMLGNFQHNPDRVSRVLRTVDEMTRYFRAAIREQERHPRNGLVQLLVNASEGGSHLSEDEVIANIIVTMVGGQETTTNLIGNAHSPRSPELVRHSRLSLVTLRSLSRVASAVNAVRASIRASAAPKQKCAAQPNATWRLSLRVRSSRSGSGKRAGSRLAAAITAITASRFLIGLSTSMRSSGASRAVC